MSEENVDSFRRAVAAYNRQDVEAVIAELDPEVEWHPAIPITLAGEAAVYRGHEGIRELLRDIFEAMAEIDAEYSEIRDLGDRALAIGHARMRGRESGAATESPVATVAEFREGKAIRVQTFLDPNEALEAAGLRE